MKTIKPTKTTCKRGTKSVTTLTYKSPTKKESTKRGRLEIKTLRRGNVTTVEYITSAPQKPKRKYKFHKPRQMRLRFK